MKRLFSEWGQTDFFLSDAPDDPPEQMFVTAELLTE